MSIIEKNAFPSDGRVLVVGLSGPTLMKKYGSRVIWLSPWEVVGLSKVPGGAVAVCAYHGIQERYMTKLKSLVETNKIEWFELEHGLETLTIRLRFWLESSPDSGPATQVVVPEKLAPEQQQAMRSDEKFYVRLDRLRRVPGQPRTHFSKAKLQELADSIMCIGLQIPIIVRRVTDDPNFDFEIVEGERRVRAHKMLNREQIWSVIQQVKNAEDQFVRSFVANLARESYTPLDTARAIQKMLAFPQFAGVGRGEAVKQVSRMAGKHELWAYQYLKLLTLPSEVQALLEPTGDDKYILPLSMGAFLCTIDDREIQLKVCDAVVKERLPLNRARNLARKLAIQAGKTAGSVTRGPDDDYQILARFLSRTVQSAEDLLDMPHRTLGELFEHRDAKVRKERLGEIDQAISLLTQLREAIGFKQQEK